MLPVEKSLIVACLESHALQDLCFDKFMAELRFWAVSKSRMDECCSPFAQYCVHLDRRGTVGHEFWVASLSLCDCQWLVSFIPGFCPYCSLNIPCNFSFFIPFRSLFCFRFFVFFYFKYVRTILLTSESRVELSFLMCWTITHSTVHYRKCDF